MGCILQNIYRRSVILWLFYLLYNVAQLRDIGLKNYLQEDITVVSKNLGEILFTNEHRGTNTRNKSHIDSFMMRFYVL